MFGLAPLSLGKGAAIFEIASLPARSHNSSESEAGFQRVGVARGERSRPSSLMCIHHPSPRPCKPEAAPLTKGPTLRCPHNPAGQPAHPIDDCGTVQDEPHNRRPLAGLNGNRVHRNGHHGRLYAPQVGGSGVARERLTYPPSHERNFFGILRAIDSLQLTDNQKVSTPVNLRAGLTRHHLTKPHRRAGEGTISARLGGTAALSPHGAVAGLNASKCRSKLPARP